MDNVEPFKGQKDQNQQHEDNQQSPERTSKPEKDNAPQGIEDQLKSKMVQRCFYPSMVKAPAPNQACGNSHHYIQNGPYRSKDPVGRVEEWLFNGNIPVIDRRLYYNTG
jgi:hypothetical protein